MARNYYAGFDARRALPYQFRGAINGALNEFYDKQSVGFRVSPKKYLTTPGGTQSAYFLHDPANSDLDGMVIRAKIKLGATTDRVGVVGRADLTNPRGIVMMVHSNVQAGFGRITTTDTYQHADTTIALTVGTWYDFWLSIKPTSGGVSVCNAWIAASASPLTNVYTGDVFNENDAPQQVAASFGVLAWNASGDFTGEIECLDCWQTDGVYSAYSWAEHANAGVRLVSVPMFGAGPYTVQWQRSTLASSGFANLSGATTGDFTDTTTTRGTLYFYRPVWTDTGNGNAQYTGEVLSFAWAGADLNISLFAHSWGVKEFLENGTTHTTLGALGHLIRIKLEQKTGRNVSVHNASVSGQTTSGFNTTNLASALTDAVANNSKYVICGWFADNDAAIETSAANVQTQTNTQVAAIKAAATGSAPMIPIVQMDGGFHVTDGSSAGRSGRTAAQLDLLISYRTMMEAAQGGPIDNSTCLRGWDGMLARALARKREFKDQLHPWQSLAMELVDGIAQRIYEIEGGNLSGAAPSAGGGGGRMGLGL